HDNSVLVLAASVDGRLPASGAAGGGVQLTEVSTARSRAVGRHHGAVRALAFLNDGRYLASAGGSQIFVSLLPAGEPRTLLGHQAVLNALAFSSDARWL